jgi:hypothetical protein
VRWSGLVEPKFTGQYTFYTVSDDGVRLWIDNQLVINNWTDHGSTENSGTVALSAGKKYSVRMEFYENGGNAVAKLLWSSVDQAKEVIPSSQLYPGQGTGLFAEYYDNDDLTNLKFTRVDPVIDFDWASGSPAPLIEPDTFSVRWTGKVEPLCSEAYTFYTVSNDGVRLWVNGQLVIDHWVDHPTVEDASSSILLSAGTPVEIKMEFKESTGDAVAKLLWSSASQTKQVVSTTQLQPNGGMLVDIPVASAVSPAFIEGTCWSPTGHTFAIHGTGAPVTMLSNKRFFSNLPLDPAAASQVSFSHNSTGVSQAGSVIWSATDLTGKNASQHQLILRKGDSLLLTALGTGLLSIDGNGDGNPEYTGVAGDKFIMPYNSAGVYIARALLNGNIAGELLVSVVDIDLNSTIASEIGFQREKSIKIFPSVLASSVIFESADSEELDVSLKQFESAGSRIFLRAKKRGTPTLIARIGSSGGPILSTKAIDEYTIKSSLEGGFFYHRDENGFGLGSITIQMEPRIENLNIAVEFFIPTMSIDGQTLFNFNSNQMQPDGTFTAPYVLVPSSDKTCHRIIVTEN